MKEGFSGSRGSSPYLRRTRGEDLSGHKRRGTGELGSRAPSGGSATLARPPPPPVYKGGPGHQRPAASPPPPPARPAPGLSPEPRRLVARRGQGAPCRGAGHWARGAGAAGCPGPAVPPGPLSELGHRSWSRPRWLLFVFVLGLFVGVFALASFLSAPFPERLTLFTYVAFFGSVCVCLSLSLSTCV
jgi:hypothetical protein